jgi:putative spermidine/putrescine transport system permease protein
MRRVPLTVAAILVGAFLVAPAFIVVPMAFNSSPFLQFPPPGWTTEWFEQFFADPTWTDALVRSAIAATGAMLIAIVLGFAAAYALVRSGHRLLRAMEPVLLLPMMVPIIVYGIAVYGVTLSLGIVGSIWVLMIAQAILALPYVLLNLSAALRTTDPRLEQVAQTLGATRWVAFRKVVLPIIAPAVAGAGLLAFALSLDEAVVALFLTGDTTPTLPVKMYTSIQYQLNPLVPVAASIMLLGTLAIVAVLGVITRQASRRGRTPQTPLDLEVPTGLGTQSS